MAMNRCDNCGESFRTLTRLRLHKDECETEEKPLDNTRVTALSKIGTGSKFQSQKDRRQNRLDQHGIHSTEEAVRQLRESIANHGVQEFIRELWYHELFRATSYAYLDEDTGLPPKMVEYLFGLATTIPPDSQSSSFVGFYDVIDSLSLVYDQLRSRQDRVLAEAESIEERKQAHIQYCQLERELTTGRFAHGTQRREFTRYVYSRIDEELTNILGFSASEAVTIADEISRYYQEMVGDNNLLPVAHRIIDTGDGPFQVSTDDAIAKAIDRPETGFPSVWVNVAKYDKHRLNPLNSEYTLGEYTDYESSFGTVREVAPEIGFTSSAFQKAVEADLPNLESFLDTLSVSFGDYNNDISDLSGSSSKFDYPFDHNPIHGYPLLVDEHDRYLLGPQNSLWYTLSTRLRYDVLGSDYEGEATRKIGRGVEAWTEECLENISDESVNILAGVNYDFQDGESDIVLLYDDAIVVLEIKTRGLRLDSRLGPYGSFEQIQQDAEEVLGSPYENQAMKLINGIKNGDVTELQSGEQSVQVNSKDFSDYIPMVVVSQPLDFLGTILHTDLLNFQDEKPYITDTYSLQTISRNLSGSQKLLEYLKKRIHIGSTGRAYSIDEMDYLGEFLANELEYPDVPDEGMINIIHSGSHLEQEYDIGVVGDMDHL